MPGAMNPDIQHYAVSGGGVVRGGSTEACAADFSTALSAAAFSAASSAATSHIGRGSGRPSTLGGANLKLDRHHWVVRSLRNVGERCALVLAIHKEVHLSPRQRLRRHLWLHLIVVGALEPHYLALAYLNCLPAFRHVQQHADDVALLEARAIRLALALVHLAALQVAVRVAVLVKPHGRLKLGLLGAPT
eukprot:350856-Chlamydomonas_euryale.AAC.7